jgi:hypothetical protein
MSASVVPSSHQPRRNRLKVSVTAVVAVLAMLVAPVALIASPANAGPVDTGWTPVGPGVISKVSDGTLSTATFTYDLQSAGFSTRSWDFTVASSAATAGSTVKVPWTWQGLHAWFQVTTKLELIVDGQPVGPALVQQGPVDCCTSPSNGFIYGGAASFTVPPAGHTYGFRLSGSNGDFNNFLQGTFTLSTKPYIDATIGLDNRDWPGATLLPGGGLTDKIVEPGEARWFKFPVVPGEAVSVDLKDLPADYDVALYGDIGQAFDQLSSGQDLTQLAAQASAGAPGSESQVPTYPTQTTNIPTSTPPSNQFAPRIYAPRIYAPRIYAPRIYAPRIYAPDSYQPDITSAPDFSQAFSAAQNQTLLAVSANGGTSPENVSASTGNTTGFFYVRVQGHTDQAFDASQAFSVNRDISDGSGCAGLNDFSGDTLLPSTTADSPADPSTVIVTDSSRIFYDQGDATSYLADLQQLADQTNGLVVDVKDSPRVQDLWDQAHLARFVNCPYAVNLVAAAVKDIVTHYRNASSKYVVIAGGDEVIPFFRYPDVSGLGQESNFSATMRDATQSQASLTGDQVLSQDAYGSTSDVTMGGATLPVPQLAVGRLVKTASEIEGTVDHYLAPGGSTLPAPTSSLVTGYDFLADAAGKVNDQLTAALGAGATNDQLISQPGDPSPWTASQLRDDLLGSTHHDVVFLAGHFSANDTLAADFNTTLNASELDPLTYDSDGNPTTTPSANAGKLENTLVLSAGCHSGYDIVDGEAASNDTADWTERMAQQHAVLIGGTGYQYGDSDFLEYSERLYLDVAKELHAGPTTGDSPAIAVGSALAQAKQDYLSGLSTVTGIDQKAMLEATLYGLPMTGFDAPNRTPVDSDTSSASSSPVLTGPGTTLGLGTWEHTFPTPTTERTKASNAEGFGLPDTSTWLEGRDGVSLQPGAPALPKQIENVTVAGQVLRGVGFRSGEYSDKGNILPVTDAPAIEGTTPNSTFDSAAFFPQRLATPNYFGALGLSGRTSLILNPAQYRNDAAAGTTNSQRTYANLGLQLFYSPPAAQTFGQNLPSQAAPPSITDVHGTVDNGVVTFSARASGDPSAGVQQVWVTWTGGPDNTGHGHWASVDLTQNLNDSTLWTGTLSLPDGTAASDVRFLVQAANGVGAVGLDTAEGDGYRVNPVGVAVDTARLSLRKGDQTSASPFGVSAQVTDQGAPVAGHQVRFSVYQDGVPLFGYTDASDATGGVTLQLPSGQTMPTGQIVIVADLLNISDPTVVVDSASVTEFVNLTLTVSPTFLVTRAGTTFAQGLGALVTDANGHPVPGVTVTFTLPTSGATATFPGGPPRPSVAQATTNASGSADSPVPAAGPVVGSFAATLSAEGAADATVPMAAQYALSTFLSPVSSPTTTTSATGTTPIKAYLIEADGSRLSDSDSAALVAANRIQIRWRQVGSTGAWSSSTTLTVYDSSKHFFQSELKASTAGLVKGKSYTVVMRVLPASGSPQPSPEDNNNPFDLGSRSFLLTVK